MQTHPQITRQECRGTGGDAGLARAVQFALSHLPGPTKGRPVRCRHCGNAGLFLARRGDEFFPCTEDHTEDGVECAHCYADATEYVPTVDGLLPLCDHHKATAAKAGLITEVFAL